MNNTWIAGRKFLFTGFTDDEKLAYKMKVEAAGGIVYGRVTNYINCVVWNENFGRETVKLKTAKEYNGIGKNIVIFTGEEFDRFLAGEEVEPSIEQESYTFNYIKAYSAVTESEKIEEYLQTHNLFENSSQEYILDLINAYWYVDFKKPEKWCDWVASNTGCFDKLYIAAGKYFSRVGDYDKAEQILKETYNRILKNAEHYFGASQAAMLVNIDELLRLNDFYRNGYPYWPERRIRREEISKIYDSKGIAHKDPNPDVKRRDGQPLFAKRRTEEERQQQWLENRDAEFTAKYVSPDYLTNSDNKYTRFCSEFGANIYGVSEATISKLLDYGLISSFGDIYRLNQHKTELINKE